MTVAAEVTSSAPKAFRPGAFALRDAWFPLVHSVRVGKRPVRRIVHGQPVVFWCDHDGLHATEDLPGTPARARRASEFTGGSGSCPIVERYGYV